MPDPSSTPSPPPAALTVSKVIDASFDGASGSLTVEFHVPDGASLNNPADADPAKWIVRYSNTVYVGGLINYDGGDSVLISFSDYGSEDGPDVLNYLADPSDVSDSLGHMLAAFSGFSI